MNKVLFLFIFTSLLLLSIYLRFANLDLAFMYPDSGYELEAARIIFLYKQIPLIGPAVGVDGLFIPPTYLYLIAIFYLIASGNVFLITVFYAMMGLATLIAFFSTVYLATKGNCKVSLLALLIMSVWQYHMHISRGIWHPHPVFFFISLSFLFGVLSFRNKKMLFLFISQFLFFIALSIYPSPIFLFPIVCLNSFYFFRTIWKRSEIKSFVFSLLSLFLFFIFVYFPQIIFEINNEFPSFHAVFSESSQSLTIDASVLVSYFQKMFKLFVKLFFYSDNLLTHSVFFFFIVFLFLVNFLFKKKYSPYLELFNNKLVGIWIIFILLLLLKLKDPYHLHRIDSLFILFQMFFLSVVYKLSFVGNTFLRHITTFVIGCFLFLFITSNLERSVSEVSANDPYSYAVNSEISKVVVSVLEQRRLNRRRSMIFYVLDNWNNDFSKLDSYLGDAKWKAEIVDHLVNKKFTYENPIIKNFQHTIYYGVYDSSFYLENADHYFIVCDMRKVGENCLNDFINVLEAVDGYGTVRFFLLDTFDVDYDFAEIQIFLLEKKEYF